MKYIDLHCDTLSKLYVARRENEALHLAGAPFQVSLEKAALWQGFCQTLAIWTPVGISSREAYQRFYNVLSLFKNELLRSGSQVALCRNAAEIEQCVSQKKTAVLLSVEGGRSAMGNLEILNDFYAEGVRIFSLTWNERNALADGAGVPDAGGLTPLGRAFVAEIERLGMILDVSHLSDRSFWDVCEIAKKPFIATHSNARAVCRHRRNVTDEMFDEIVKREGLIGINLAREFLNDTASDANASSVVRHIEHFLQRGGAKTIAMGADFDGAHVPEELAGIDRMHLIAEALLKANHPQSLVDDIFWNNTLSFLKKQLTE